MYSSVVVVAVVLFGGFCPDYIYGCEEDEMTTDCQTDGRTDIQIDKASHYKNHDHADADAGKLYQMLI